MTSNDLIQARFEKLAKIKELGLNPFIGISVERANIAKVREAKLDSSHKVAGRIQSIRQHGKITFIDINDESAKIQLAVKQDVVGDSNYKFIELLDIGDFIWANGKLFITKANELTLEVSEYSLLTKSLRPLPSEWYGFKDIEERYRQRYVDLIINEDVKKVFDTRHKVVRFIRNYMENSGFIEVETPTMQPLYGGASAKPFTTHHNALDNDFYLRISDELYLKRLIVGGYEKVFEICKDFRNEGIDKQHNPEFTMMEFYWAYVDYNDLMVFTENMVSEIVKLVQGGYQFEFDGTKLDFTPPFKRITFRDLVLENSGIDLDKFSTFETLLAEIGAKKIKVDLDGVVGYGALCDELYKKTSRVKVTNPIFLIDYPYEILPLAKRSAKNERKSASFQLVCMGYELVKAYNELNDPIDQRARWEEEMHLGSKGADEHQVVDEDYIRALEYGMPPTAGWGMGIDRLVSLVTNQKTLKDVILFPTLRPENMVVTSGPKVQPTSKKIDSVAEAARQAIDSNLKKDYMSSDQKLTHKIATDLLHSKMTNINLRRHCYAVSLAMRALHQYLKTHAKVDNSLAHLAEEDWGIVGLLHDADYELTKTDITQHTVLLLDWLKVYDVHAHIVEAFQSHNTKVTNLREPQTLLEWSLECCDELTGFIVACALVMPEKKLSGVTLETVKKKWKQKEFAKAVNRSQTEHCEERLGIKLDDFISIVLTAMQENAEALGL